jgi:hypothetical protein
LESVVATGPGVLSIVTSQPFVRGRDAEQGEIDAMMIEMDFERIGEGMYYHSGEGLLVHDLVPKNAKFDPDGCVLPIDPVIQRITPAFADYFRRNPISGKADAK